MKKAYYRANSAHSLREGADFYFTEEGFMVFTATYLARRGYCCGSGCRHCPYRRAK